CHIFIIMPQSTCFLGTEAYKKVTKILHQGDTKITQFESFCWKCLHVKLPYQIRLVKLSFKKLGGKTFIACAIDINFYLVENIWYVLTTLYEEPLIVPNRPMSVWTFMAMCIMNGAHVSKLQRFVIIPNLSIIAISLHAEMANILCRLIIYYYLLNGSDFIIVQEQEHLDFIIVQQQE
ncbi:hypothetical protein ACJX0J_015410, partial [Zea mays]